MMTTHYEVTGEDGNRRTVRFKMSAEEVTALFARIRRDISRDVSMPGFRPGKIPASIIEKRYGNIIVAEVADRIREDLTTEALGELDWILGDVNPEGKIDLPADGEEYGFELTFTLFETPEPVDYSGIEIPIPRVDLDKALEDTLQSFRERLVEFNSVERPAGNDDLVILETIPAGNDSDEPRTLTVRIGEEQIGPGFDDLLRNTSAGDGFSARMESISGDDKASGDPHRFLVTGVSEAVLPDLDDDLAKKVADVDSLDELRTRISKNIEKRHEDEVKYLTERIALDALLDSNPFDPPEYMVKNLSTDFLARLDEDEPSEETVQAVKEMAAKKVREFLILRAIGLKEGIEVTGEEIEKELNPEESPSSLLDRLRNRHAVEHVLSQATIIEKDEVQEVGKTAESPWRWVKVTEDEAETESVPAGSKEG
jgi:trigger factor